MNQPDQPIHPAYSVVAAAVEQEVEPQQKREMALQLFSYSMAALVILEGDIAAVDEAYERARFKVLNRG